MNSQSYICLWYGLSDILKNSLFSKYDIWVLHNNLKGVLVFGRSVFPLQSSRYKAELGVFFFNMFNSITDTVIYITESKLTKLKEK